MCHTVAGLFGPLPPTCCEVLHSRAVDLIVSSVYAVWQGPDPKDGNETFLLEFP